MFKLEFETDNDAFQGYSELEIARILRAVARRVETGTLSGPALDRNGNTIGSFELTED